MWPPINPPGAGSQAGDMQGGHTQDAYNGPARPSRDYYPTPYANAYMPDSGRYQAAYQTYAGMGAATMGHQHSMQMSGAPQAPYHLPVDPQAAGYDNGMQNYGGYGNMHYGAHPVSNNVGNSRGDSMMYSEYEVAMDTYM